MEEMEGFKSQQLTVGIFTEMGIENDRFEWEN